MRSIQVEVTSTATGDKYVDCTGMVLNSLALTFTGTATAKVQVNFSNGTWVDLGGLESTSTNTLITSAYSLGQLKLVTEAYTDGEVKLTVRGIRG